MKKRLVTQVEEDLEAWIAQRASDEKRTVSAMTRIILEEAQAAASRPRANA